MIKLRPTILQANSPLVAKPSNTGHGDGVSVGISDEKSLRSAINYALKNSKDADIILQEQVNGSEYRFLVLKDKVIAVANRRPPYVVGDGTKTIRELIKVKNSDPRRGDGHTSPLTKINLDEIKRFLGNDKLHEIPQVGEEVELLKTSTLSRGGEAIDFTDQASESLKNIAVRAAKECLVGVAGVDIITEDITGETGYIIEVNASPGLRMHQFPSVGQPRNVAKMIFDELEKTAIKIR